MLKNRKGISLIELVLTLALIGIVLQVGFSVLSVGSTSHGLSTNKGFAQQDVRIVGDFISKELKNVTDISDSDDFDSTYYSLSVIDDISKGQKKLIKHKLVYTGDGSEEDKSTKTKKTQEIAFSGNWNSIKITNSIMGEILVEITQSEGQGNKEAKFEIPITISTINDSGLLVSDLDIDLVSGDVLYYSNKSLELLTRGIEIGEISTNEGEKNEEVTVIFDSDGGSPAISKVIGKFGESKDLPEDPERDGFDFSGWYSQKNGLGSKYTKSKITIPNANVTYYAKWDVKEIIEEKIELSKLNSDIIIIDWQTKDKFSKLTGPEDTIFNVGNNNELDVKIPLEYKKGTTNLDPLNLKVTTTNWSTRDSIKSEIIQGTQYVVISGNAGNKNLKIKVDISLQDNSQPISYKFELQ